jgi:hypothetical protein
MQSVVSDAMSVSVANRRAALRYTPEEVPWITTVKLMLGGSAQLVNISQTGILTDTHARLGPGRRHCVVLRVDDAVDHRIEGVVIRAELVGLSTSDGPIYRTALQFVEALAVRLPVASESPSLNPDVTDYPLVEGPHLSGPFDGVWSSGSSPSQLITVREISESDCLVESAVALAPGDPVPITIFFSEYRYLNLSGQITDSLSDTTYAVRFKGLNADQCRALRVEIRAQRHPAEKRSRRATLCMDATLAASLPAVNGANPGLVLNQW